MDMMEAMKQSEAVEIALRNGHVVYSRYLGVSDGNYLLCDPDGALVFVPTGADNLAYVKVVSPDPEIPAEAAPEQTRPSPANRAKRRADPWRRSSSGGRSSRS